MASKLENGHLLLPAVEARICQKQGFFLKIKGHLGSKMEIVKWRSKGGHIL
jgi:hypothetical protein